MTYLKQHLICSKKLLFFGFILIQITSNFLNSQTIFTYAGTGTVGCSGDGGAAILAKIGISYLIDIDNNGNLYLPTRNTIRKVNSSGIINTIASTCNSAPGFGGDGGQATSANVNHVYSIKADNLGNIYFNDAMNFRIRKINSNGIISTIAGTGSAGCNGNGGNALNANINLSNGGITTDVIGNIYFCETGCNYIRKIDTNNIITIVAGNGIAGFSGDGGQAINSQINNPIGICIDNIGNIYFSDYGNFRIRKIDTSGIITTIAGNGIIGYNGDGGAALSANINPFGIACDNLNNVYFADYNNSVVRRISNTGIITTVAGTGAIGYSGDGGNPIMAKIATPFGLTIDSNNNIYIAHAYDMPAPLDICVRVICNNNCLSKVEDNYIDNFYISISPNPAKSELFINVKEQFLNGKFKLYNLVGELVKEITITKENEIINLSEIENSVYFYTLTNEIGNLFSGKVIKE